MTNKNLVVGIVLAALTSACVSAPRPTPQIILRDGTGATPDVEQADCHSLEGDKLALCELGNRLARETAARRVAEDKVTAAETRRVSPAAPVPTAAPAVGGLRFDQGAMAPAIDLPAIANSDGTLSPGRTLYNPSTVAPVGGSGIKFFALESGVESEEAGRSMVCFFRSGAYTPVSGGVPIYVDVTKSGRVTGTPLSCVSTMATVWWAGVRGNEELRLLYVRPIPATQLAGHPVYQPFRAHDFRGWEGGGWKERLGRDGWEYYL